MQSLPPARRVAELGSLGRRVVRYSIIIVVVFVALFAWTWLIIRRSTSTLRKWAAEHGYVILRSEIVLGLPLRAAALSLWNPSSAGRVEYSVTLRDRTGLKRSARVCSGSFVRGVFSRGEIEVTWSDETAT